jgi:hypothetical protein
VLRQLFGVAVAFVIGGVMVWPLPQLVRIHVLASDAPSFAATPCTHVEQTYEHSRLSDHSAEPLLVCSYVVDGQPHRTDSEFSDVGFSSIERDGMVTTWESPRARSREAYYDPTDPSRATMSRRVTYNKTWWAAVVLGGVSLIVGLVALLRTVAHGLRALHTRRSARADFPTARLR